MFSLVNSELRQLFDFIETRICRHPEVTQQCVETLDATIFAMSQEIKKVFSHELVGLVYLRHAPPIFAKVENSHGLLKNSLQQSIVQISQAFDPGFDGKQLFLDLHDPFGTVAHGCFRRSRHCWRVCVSSRTSQTMKAAATVAEF